METLGKTLVIALSCFRLGVALEITRYYPRYHLAPPAGWMNDPNGFCVFNGEYHLFYQHNPDSSQTPGNTIKWGHAKSKDLFHWVDLGVALTGDKEYDTNGVFSGSAVVDSNVMNIFYTGHVLIEDAAENDPTYRETQALATSTDGVTFAKYDGNPIITGSNLQPDFRDPKVWKHGNTWYMIVGNSLHLENDVRHGRVILFKSLNKINWEQVSILDESDGSLGYMWECPDFFEIDGRFVLLFSPQGVTAQGDKYKNLYQTGYIVGHFDYQYGLFTPETEFRELDFGHDFYATQTILDNSGRRLLVAWMDMWETSYPEKGDGFNGQMTIVRSLSLTQDNRLIQKPVNEVTAARGNPLFVGSSYGESKVPLSNKAGEVIITAPREKDFTLNIGSDSSSVEIKYDFVKGTVTLTRPDDDGVRRTKYRPLTKLKMRVFIDASSIEVFLGDGEVTFSSRYFIDDIISVHVSANSVAELFVVYEYKSTLYLTQQS